MKDILREFPKDLEESTPKRPLRSRITENIMLVGDFIYHGKWQILSALGLFGGMSFYILDPMHLDTSTFVTPTKVMVTPTGKPEPTRIPTPTNFPVRTVVFPTVTRGPVPQSSKNPF